MQIQISFVEKVVENQISFVQALDLKTIQELKNKLERMKEQSRFLYGKRKGCWGRMTAADEKRSLEITKIQNQIQFKIKTYNQNYGQNI
jgi:hypothetical protein